MQTFLPHDTFPLSAKVLDGKRLNKQLLEGRQILNLLVNGKPGDAWFNHPAVVMWRGADLVLYGYLVAIAREMESRNIEFRKNLKVIHNLMENSTVTDYIPPEWYLDESRLNRVTITHRGNLYLKDKNYYAQYVRDSHAYLAEVCCPGKCNYYWPSHDERG